MENNITYTQFFNQFKESIKDDTFAKLTFAKTIGNTELMNIYIRTIIVEGELLLNLKFKHWHEEIISDHTIDEAILLLTPYIGNPFSSVLLFTTESDVTLKLNKKRVASITEKEPTFKNPDMTLIEFRALGNK